MFHLACYDIEDDNHRLRVSKILGLYGNRVQESVFELELRGDAEIAEITEALRAVSDEPLDVRFYPICEGCRSSAFALSGTPVAKRPSALII